MKAINKISKLLGTAALVLMLSMVDFSIKSGAPRSGNGLANFTGQIGFFNEAQATLLDELDPNGESMANHIRFMYMLINGPGANGYPTGMGGPDGGFLGMIRDITGSDALGGGLTSAGYSNCTDIPATGSASMDDTDGTFTMYFETPIIAIPTGHTGAGGNFDKRVVVQFQGTAASSATTFMNIEFNCDTTVGWMRMTMGDGADVNTGTSREIEVYYDTETATDSHLELYMTYEPGTADGNEYFIAKFDTLSSTTYNFWLIRAFNSDANIHGIRAGAHGDSSTDMVNAYMNFIPNDLTDATTDFVTDGGTIASGDIQCVDFTTPGSPVDGLTGCDALTMTDPGTPINDSTGSYSINWVADSAGLSAKMTTLADPAN